MKHRFPFKLLLLLLPALISASTNDGTSSSSTSYHERQQQQQQPQQQSIQSESHNHAFTEIPAVSPGRKRLQQTAVQSDEEKFGCNEIVDTIPSDQIQEFLLAAVDEQLGGGGGGMDATVSAATIFLKATIISRSLHGIQLRKICASCQDFEDDIDHEDYQRYCGPQAYGYNQTFSGLVVLPLSQVANNTDLQPGTLPGSLWVHPTIVNTPPSTSYRGTSSHFETLLFGMIPASFGIPAIMPDYFGYGVSNGKIFKGYVIRQSYETSVVPIWYKAAQIMREESNCQTELANELVVSGYSEGGYSGPVVAHVLNTLGWTIMRVHSGAAPARVGSTLMPGLINSVATGNYPAQYTDILMLFASSYSSTYQDVPNFETGQDVLKPEFREDVINLVNSAPGRAGLLEYLGDKDWLRIFDDRYITWALEVHEAGDMFPCATRFEPGFNDFICPAFLNNDITELLETTPFPIQMCHGIDDEVVIFENLPDFSQNENLTLMEVGGSHLGAGAPCFAAAFGFFTTPDFQNYRIRTKHSQNGCSASPSPGPPPPSRDSTPSPTGVYDTESDTTGPPSNAETPRPTAIDTLSPSSAESRHSLSIFAAISTFVLISCS